MSSNRDHFRSFADHTLLKHAILRSYLLQWATILLSRKGGQSEVVFIDCFAGAGRDQEGNEGSPLIAAAAQRAIHQMVSDGKLPSAASLRIAVVERDKTLFKQLSQLFEQHNVDDSSVFLKHGNYRDYLAELAGFRGNAPCLTFLDPFGVSGIDAASFPVFLAPLRSELLILVSGIGASRLHGVLSADGREFDIRKRALQEAPGLFPEMDAQSLAQIEDEREDYAESLDATKPKAAQALLTALGSEQAVANLQQLPKPERPVGFVRAIASLLRDAGASHVLSIPMRDAKGALKYTLLHASKSERAVSAMKEAVSTGLKRDDLAAVMRDRIRRDLSVPVVSYIDWLSTTFTGTGEYWAWGRRDRPERSFQEILLETTPIFTFQLPELKQELKARGFLTTREKRDWIQFR